MNLAAAPGGRDGAGAYLPFYLPEPLPETTGADEPAMSDFENIPEQLYNLQELDRRIADLDAERGSLESKLAAGFTRPDLSGQAQRHYDRAMTISATLKTRRTETEHLRERLAGLESRLYSANTSRRDLSAIQREVDSAKYQMSQLDSMLTQLEVEQRNHEEAARVARAEMAEAETHWQEAIAGINARLSELERERGEAVAQRLELVDAIPQDYLQLYDRLRRNKSGTAVAQVDNLRDVCRACHITLTGSVARQLRAKTRLVYCNACGRLLYRP